MNSQGIVLRAAGVGLVFVRRMRSPLRRAREVGPGGMRLLIRTFWFLLWAKVALRSMPMKKIVAWKQRALVHPRDGAMVVEQCARVRWAVLVVARYSPVAFVCFPQCLAASELLRGYGIQSRLHYGVGRDAAKLRMHTWLEAGGGIVIGGEVADQFSTLDVY